MIEMSDTIGGVTECDKHPMTPNQAHAEWSRACMADAHSIDPADFWKHVDKTARCWLWLGSRNYKGYGLYRSFKAHRVAWLLTFGDIPNGLCVCHACDNPPCVNPSHLWLGTHQANATDKMRKGRYVASLGERHGTKTHPESVARGDRNSARLHPDKLPRGERHGMAKLTCIQVAQIIARYASGTETQRGLAKEFGVSQRQILRIVHGVSWKPFRAR